MYINNNKDFTVGKNITFIDKDDNIIKMGSIIAKTKNGDILILENDVIDKLKYSKAKNKKLYHLLSKKITNKKLNKILENGGKLIL